MQRMKMTMIKTPIRHGSVETKLKFSACHQNSYFVDEWIQYQPESEDENTSNYYYYIISVMWFYVFNNSFSTTW